MTDELRAAAEYVANPPEDDNQHPPQLLSPIAYMHKAGLLANAYLSDLTDRENAERMQADDPRNEKDRRIYYQDIVYYVCNKLDKIFGGTHVTVCGSWAEPSTEVQERMDKLADREAQEADDAKLVDEAWLRSVGSDEAFRLEASNVYLKVIAISEWFDGIELWQREEEGVPQEGVLAIHEIGERLTRGQVRRLSEAIGNPLEEL